MSKNPVDIDIKLKNGQIVELSASRDYIYNKKIPLKNSVLSSKILTLKILK